VYFITAISGEAMLRL